MCDLGSGFVRPGVQGLCTLKLQASCWAAWCFLVGGKEGSTRFIGHRMLAEQQVAGLYQKKLGNFAAVALCLFMKGTVVSAKKQLCRVLVLTFVHETFRLTLSP